MARIALPVMLLLAATVNAHAQRATATPGPLVVSKTNPRYFTAAGRAVYLTGSHIWNNLNDGMGPGAACAASPEAFDYPGYLAFLKAHGHNFIRLWRWEQFKSQAAGGNYHLCMAPQPWARTGPGSAKDGKPRFDLSKFDPTFFDRLRQRVSAAGKEGIYVSVMLFDGWALHLSPAPDNVDGHPFHEGNNNNGVAIKSITDYQVLPLDPKVQAFEEAYIRKVIDAVHDLPNVLYEVANESSGGGAVDTSFANALGLGSSAPQWGNSTTWQYWVIDVVKRYERQKGYAAHPIGMTMQFPVVDQTRVNDPLFVSRAEWISPGYDDSIFTGGRFPMAPGAPASHWFDDPPAATGKKVIITDTDHYAPGKGDALWAWKSFLRGHNPILMDFGLISGVKPGDPAYAAFEAARFAMGDTRRYAERMDLLEMRPRSDVSSSGYALVNFGKEYLILRPSGATFIAVQLPPGTYTVEWYNVTSRATQRGPTTVTPHQTRANFTSPFGADASVLYLKRARSHWTPPSD